jgi:hypothetical protein
MEEAVLIDIFSFIVKKRFSEQKKDASISLAAIRQPAFDALFQPGNPLWVQAVTGGSSINIAADDPGFPQDLKMLADRRLRQGGKFHQLPGDAHSFFRQHLHDIEPHRVSQGFEHPGQALFVGCERSKGRTLFH